jgi:hypothetical protein
MFSFRIGYPVLRGGEPEAQFGAEHGPHPVFGSGLGEPDDPVHTVVIGEGDSLQP